jgi:hypothetical protein
MPWTLDKLQARSQAKVIDPISPYLFLLRADVLQILIKKNPAIRHPIVDDEECPVLQYADDTLLLVRGL